MMGKTRFGSRVEIPGSGRDTERIEFKRGGGAQTLFGIPFISVGVLALLTCIGLIPMEGEGGEMAFMAAGFFGAAFAVLGALLLFGRSGLTIDRRLGEVIQWRGLIVPISKTTYPLARFDRVRLERRGEGEGRDYAVLLLGKDIPEAVLVEQIDDCRLAMRTAERLALFLEKPLEDLTGAAGPDR